MNRPGAIVFGGGSTGLGVIRSLGRRGITVIAADYDKHSIVFSSKYTHERVIIPDPAISGEAMITFLLENLTRWRNNVLIPCHDSMLQAISQNKAELSKHYMVAVPEWGALEKCLNKRMTFQTSIDASVPTAQALFPDSIGYLENHVTEIQYPCILKPTFSRKFADEFRVKVFKVRDFDELKYYYRLANKTGNEMMVQEIIPGADDQLCTYYSYRDLNSNTLAEFTCRKIRQSPPSFGVITAGESTYTPELMELGRRFLDKLEYTGVSGIEFKRDVRDNQFKLIEINARFGTVIALPIRCGIDLPWILYTDLVNQEKVLVDTYPAGMKWVYLATDVMALLRYYPKKQYKLSEFFKTYREAKVYAVYARDDFQPFIKDWLWWLRQSFGFLFRLLFKKSWRKPGKPALG